MDLEPTVSENQKLKAQTNRLHELIKEGKLNPNEIQTLSGILGMIESRIANEESRERERERNLPIVNRVTSILDPKLSQPEKVTIIPPQPEKAETSNTLTLNGIIDLIKTDKWGMLICGVRPEKGFGIGFRNNSIPEFHEGFLDDNTIIPVSNETYPKIRESRVNISVLEDKRLNIENKVLIRVHIGDTRFDERDGCHKTILLAMNTKEKEKFIAYITDINNAKDFIEGCIDNFWPDVKLGLVGDSRGKKCTNWAKKVIIL
ncbi:MAG: hypothetical protein PHE25_04680 [Candidatus Gracilibacteria bacterium]|nr:hypothetical protein [Candidatus Gracilibacteria bacterium]